MTMPDNASSKNKMGCKIAVLITLFFVSLAFIISYVVYESELNERLESATEVCSENDEGYDTLYSTSTQESVNWVYNLSNPLEYLRDGDEAHFMELGGYSYDVDVTRTDPVFLDGGDRVQYTLYLSGAFNEANSPSGLAATDDLYSVNVGYLTVLGRAKSEAVLLLTAACGRTQVGILNNNGFPVCRTEEMNTATMCRCCSPTPLENSTTCSDIATTTSQAGGLISYLAMLDGGVQLDNTPSAFPLSSGAHSPLVVKKNVDALLLGTPSAVLGSFMYQGGEEEDKMRISNTTADLAETCSALGYCPTLPELMVQVAQAGSFPAILGIVKSLDCSGVIPDTAGLMDAGFTEARALELRYLKGVNCRPYTATLAVAGLISATAGQGSTHTCAGEGQLPCCLSAFTIPGMSSGAGLGCLMWVPGAMITRQTYTVEEAHRYLTPSPVNELYTGCADDDEAFGMISWQGRQAIDRWYVPTTYTYPDMPWADPAIVPVTTVPPAGVAGEMTVRNLTGNTIFGRRGTGITSGYLDYELTDGEPVKKEETVVNVQGLSTKNLVYSEKSDVGGVPTNTFLYNYPTEYTAAEDEERQRTGEMPYAHLTNLRYSKNIAAIASLPNWFAADDAVYSQENNTAIFGAPGGGVSLYRTRVGYTPDSALLDTPVVMTGESVAALKDEMTGFAKIEPATGAALHTRVQNMASGFTWNCNPALDTSCALLASPYDAANPMCYPNMAGANTQLPCSNANVFTPRVRGGKVLPVFWSRANLKPDGVVDAFLKVMDTRHALAVMSIAMPLLFVILGGIFLITGLIGGGAKVAVYSPSASGGDGVTVETAKLVNEDNQVRAF